MFAIIGLWFIGAQSLHVDAEYKSGTAYQYFLLGSKGSEVKEDSKNEKILKLGSLGSGGVSGQMSYDEIVNTASNSDQAEAKQFASTMATYSTFNYFSNKPESFSVIFVMATRILMSLILVPLALMMDIIHLIIPTLISLLAKLNVISLLGSVVANLDGTAKLLEATGIKKETFKTLIDVLMIFSAAMIVLALVSMFKSSKGVDQRSFSKLKGRVITFIALPIIVGISATLIQQVMLQTEKSEGLVGNYSRYLVDSRSWAYNFNFAPNGNNGKDGDIKPTKGSSYVDLKYDPYTVTGEARIKRINSQSSLANNEGGNMFPNTALALTYGSSQSFSATDFINYKGTKASESFYGQTGSGGKGFGTYYQYAQEMKKTLIDVDHSYTPSGKKKSGEGATTDQKGGYTAAIDDYSDGKKLTVTPSIAWRDRYIYGAKNSGAKLDDYYSETPSVEQMENEVGTNGEQAFSNQSMYLILSTQFDETGGRYFIESPARGINKVKATFDSNRSNYFVVSMVGNPFFTIFGLVATPILQLVVFLAVAMSIVSLGLLEMNVRPLVAWFKGMTLGDIEYAIAFLVYAVGIAGTVLTLVVMPPLIVAVFLYVPKLLLVAFTIGKNAFSPQASLALNGTPLIISALFSIFVAFLFWKSKSFRYHLAEAFTFVWFWAKSTGERLELQASGGSSIRVKQEQQQGRMRLNNMLNETKNKSNNVGNRVRNWLSEVKKDVDDDIEKDKEKGNKLKNNKTKKNAPEYSGRAGNNTTADDNSLYGYNGEEVQDTNTIERNGMFERADNSLRGLENNQTIAPRAKTITIDAQEALMNYKKAPNNETFKMAMAQLDLLQSEIGEEDIQQTEKINIARNELYNLQKSFAMNESVHGQGVKGDIQKEQNNVGNKSKIFMDEGQQDIYKQVNLTQRTYENEHVRKLAHNLGRAIENEDVRESLYKLDSSKTTQEKNGAVGKLQKSITQLDADTREQLDRQGIRENIEMALEEKPIDE